MGVWQSSLTLMVRNLIDDFGNSPTFTDDRIQQAIVVAGLIASNEYNFSAGYTFDLENIDISPDPAASATSDPLAIALFTLKAACLLDTNKYQKAASNGGVLIVDGDTEIDTSKGFKGYADIITLGPCASYEKLIRHSSILQSMTFGASVMTPISHAKLLSFGPQVGTSRFFDMIGW